jgi:hypothetical protein
MFVLLNSINPPEDGDLGTQLHDETNHKFKCKFKFKCKKVSIILRINNYTNKPSFARATAGRHIN